MTTLRLSTVFAALLTWGTSSILAQTNETDSDRLSFPASGITIPKQPDRLKFVDSESTPDGSDMMARFANPEIGLDISLAVYASPPETTGPTLMLNINGQEILEDRDDVKKTKNAVFKLNDPSDHYLNEFRRTLESIQRVPYMADSKLETEFRFMAVPKRKDSPIAYAAIFTGPRKVQNESIRWTWKTYLYSIPGYFVKIHCTYPSEFGLDVGAIDVNFIQAINWSLFLPPEESSKTK